MIILILLWLLIWSAYNTCYFSYNKGFNKWRSLFPLITLIYSLFYFKDFSINPINLLLLYGVCGIIGSFFSTWNKIFSWYWAIPFITPVIFLSIINNSLLIIFILNTNWIIASLISLILIGNFLIKPGVLRSITFNSFFANSVRPYEGWLNVPHEAKILGLVGTRPTGLARYSGITSLVMLCLFLTYNNWYSFIGFILFTFILLFSKGKTEMLAFIASMGFILFITHNLLSLISFIYLIIVIISYIIIFGNIPYRFKNTVKIEPLKIETIKPEKVIPIVQEKLEHTTKVEKLNEDVVIYFQRKTFINRILTLSGRINGIWLDALVLIKKSLLFGYGFGSERYLLKDENGHPASVDSTILNALLQAGIVGTLFFVSSLILTIILGYDLSSNLSLNILECYAVGIFILIRGITQSFSGYSADLLFLLPIIAYLQILHS